MIRLWSAVACLSFATLVIGANPREQRIRRVTQHMPPPVLVRGEAPLFTSLAARMEELRVPGVSIAVIHRGHLEWARGFGATRPGGPPVTETTLFQAASISKPVFALAVLRLADAGKVDLRANVNDYLKSWKVPDDDFTRRAPVTLRAILSHSAGITAGGFRGYESNASLPTLVQILDGVAPANSSAVRIDTTPGDRFRYAGGGYVVAQAVLQDVIDRPLAPFLDEFLLKPLGMDRSTFEQPLPAARAAGIALPYRANGSAVEGGPHVYPELAAAGLWTTPTDLARYALGVHAALQGKARAIIAPRTARAMLTPVIEHQGLGPDLGGRTARKFFTHNGGNEGYRCLLVAYEDGDGAVVMTNSDSGGVLMEEVMRSIALEYGWPDYAPARRALANLNPARLAPLAGAYRFDDGSIYIVRERGGRLEGRTPGQEPVQLFAASDRQLFARSVDLVLDFDVAADTVTSLRQRAGETDRRAPRTTETESRKLLAWLDVTDQRIREQVADSRGEASVRALLADISAGKPDYRGMNPVLAETIGQQLPALQPWFAWLGELKRLTFVRVDARGRDEYRGEFTQGPLRILIRLDADGRLDGAEFAPG